MEIKRLGVMVDCSRNAVPTVCGIKRFADKMNKMGYNTLMLYTEDTYEAENEPYFGYFRGRYTTEELIEIVEYCEKTGIEVIPCIQTLAHLNRIFLWQPYKEINDVNDILLVDEERTYVLIKNMFKSLRKSFKTDYIHIGMDEAHMLGAGKYRDNHGIKPQTELFLTHLKRVCDIAAEYGFKPIIWSDMFFRMQFGGEYYVKTGQLTEDVIARIPENLELVYWDYYHYDSETYAHMIKEHKRTGRNTWFAGGAWKWEGFRANCGKTIKTITPALEECFKSGVKNVIMTCWGDDGNECPLNAVLPSLFYVSEYVKGNKNISGIKERFYDVFGESWNDFALLDLNPPESTGKRDEFSSGSKTMLYSDVFTGFEDSAVWGDRREDLFYGELSKKLFYAAKTSNNYGYIFESYSDLCRVLSLKYSLGARTREIYKSRDKNALKNLIKDYKNVIKYLEKFIVSFGKMWMTDNKPFGLEVQEIRLGGLKQRLECCRGRLKEYLAGKITAIEELEIELLDVHGGDKRLVKGVFDECQYKNLVSVNVL